MFEINVLYDATKKDLLRILNLLLLDRNEKTFILHKKPKGHGPETLRWKKVLEEMRKRGKRKKKELVQFRKN